MKFKLNLNPVCPVSEYIILNRGIASSIGFILLSPFRF